MKEELCNHTEKTWKTERIARSPHVKTRMSGVCPFIFAFFPTFTISHFYMLVSLMTCERHSYIKK